MAGTIDAESRYDPFAYERTPVSGGYDSEYVAPQSYLDAAAAAARVLPVIPQVYIARPRTPWVPNLTPRAWSTVPGSTAAPMAQAMSMNPAAQAQPNSMLAALLQMYSGAGQAPQQAPQQPMQRGMFR